MPDRYNQLLNDGLPFDFRWYVWKVKFHDEDDYDPLLY